MKYKIILAIILIIWIVPTLVNADIKIQTLPDHQVQITLFNEVNDDFLVLERLEGVSDENGEVSFTTAIEASFNLLVFVKKDGETVLSKKYLDNYKPDENIYLEILPQKSFLITIYILLGISVLVAAYIVFRKAQKISSTDNHRSIELEVIRNGKKVSIGRINLRS